MHKKIKEGRSFMRSDFGKHSVKSDQQKGLSKPSLQKEYDSESKLIALPSVEEISFAKMDFKKLVKNRKSLRNYSNKSLTLKELSLLLWSTQGVKQVIRDGYATYRTVPSAGARHPYETYLIVNRVENLKAGIFRYLPLEHKLLFCFSDRNIGNDLDKATFGQKFIARSAVIFVWSAIPYRSEWRYSVTAHKPMLLDAGHICQNLYLACEVIDSGTCAIAAYDQTAMDQLLRLEGEDEFVVYLSPVGKK